MGALDVSLWGILWVRFEALRAWFSNECAEAVGLTAIVYIIYRLYQFWLKEADGRSIKDAITDIVIRLGLIGIMVLPNSLLTVSGGGEANFITWFPYKIIETGWQTADKAAGIAAQLALGGGGGSDVKFGTMPKLFKDEVDNAVNTCAGIFKGAREAMGDESAMAFMDAGKGGLMDWIGNAFTTGLGALVGALGGAATGAMGGIPGVIAGAAIGGALGGGLTAFRGEIVKVIFIAVVTIWWFGSILFYMLRALVYSGAIALALATLGVMPRSGAENVRRAVMNGFGFALFPTAMVFVMGAVIVIYQAIMPWYVDYVTKFVGMDNGFVAIFFTVIILVTLTFQLAHHLTQLPMVLVQAIGVDGGGVNASDNSSHHEVLSAGRKPLRHVPGV